MHFLKDSTKFSTLSLVLLVGILINVPYANFQNFLSQGDHGLNLYAFQAVYKGDFPYKDFYWQYGPLMPYYYCLFFKFFGVQLSSVILGKLILKVLAGLLVCLAMMEVSSEAIACLCACWFMLFAQDFFYNYNHIGGLVMVLGAVFCLLSYIRNNSLKAAWGALGFILTLCLIKINFGLAALAVCLITVKVNDSVRHLPSNTNKKIFYASAFIGLPLILFIIYGSLLKGLSFTEILQCLPYMPGYDPSHTDPLAAIMNFLITTIHTATSTWENFIFAVLINASAFRCLYLFQANKLEASRKITFLLSLSMLCLFYVVNCHEYLKSGVWYRIFWAQPLSIMLTFLLIDIASQSIPKIGRAIVISVITFLVIYSGLLINFELITEKASSPYLYLPRAGIYIANSPSWTLTVEETTEFLNKTLKPNELFLAIPYDCLYYFLTDKKSPTRQLVYFDYLKIPNAQEKSIIAELEKNHVNYILLSNRAYAKEDGLGFLGKSYCPLIGKYIKDNFVPLVRFGDWKNDPGWAWNHGTLILKRKGT